MNPIEKYPHITESHACILKMFAIMFLLLIIFFHFFGDMLYSKAIKVCHSFVIYIYIHPMSSNIRIFIKIYYKDLPSFISSGR